MTWHQIFLRQLREDLHHLDTAEGRLVLEALEEELEELVLRLLIYLPSLDHLIVAGVQCRLIVTIKLAKHENDRVGQDLDQALPKEVRLTVEETKKATYVPIDCSWRLFRKLL